MIMKTKPGQMVRRGQIRKLTGGQTGQVPGGGKVGKKIRRGGIAPFAPKLQSAPAAKI